ncbi:acylneuraminate cytidylyltransferase family protein [Oscillospiraceae bacterium OttesenSCG-928-F05]|nr:acylneuraminate cytidylyltransferase family protein [Oscillospiraceae bacterium OttesenSCG-928-F05]
MKTVAFVTIRLNSKRVPQKNIKMVGSRPMCWHVVNTLLQVPEIDDVYVYCSDPVIKEYIPGEAIFLQRDKYLDGDLIKAKDTYSAFIKDVDADIYLAGCTTSPFTQVSTVADAVRQVQSGKYDSAFSAKRIQTFAWYNGSPINYDPQDVPRTQDMEPVFVETSAFFIFKKEIWTEHGRRIGFHPYISEVGEIESIDIDTPEDFEFANLIAEHIQKI